MSEVHAKEHRRGAERRRPLGWTARQRRKIVWKQHQEPEFTPRGTAKPSVFRKEGQRRQDERAEEKILALGCQAVQGGPTDSFLKVNLETT